MTRSAAAPRRLGQKFAFALPICVAMLLAGCSDQGGSSSIGDIKRGKLAASQYGCPTCHRIPGIAGSPVWVGPSLDQMARRQYIGGVLANVPGNMIAWLQDPPSIKPATAMPKLGVSTRDAQDIAAYLYTLR